MTSPFASFATEVQWTAISPCAGGGKGAAQLRSGTILATRTQWSPNGVSVVCSQSTDRGGNWKDISVIDKNTVGHDLGDGHLLELPSGEILFSYRNNSFGRTNTDLRHYSICIASSRDEGKSWRHHSIVAQSTVDPVREPEALRGLWSSFLLLNHLGELQCYYDDEDTPYRQGFPRHQWLTMKTWDNETRQWTRPRTVSRAHNPHNLSRDGMASVLELRPGKLLCAFESVQAKAPHANCIRMVSSADNGKTWNWHKEERQILYQPVGQHLAVSPWLAKTSVGNLICVFATDEDRENPSAAGTHPLRFRADIKSIWGSANGKTWGKTSQTVFDATHRSYAPGVITLNDGSLLVTAMDYSDWTHRAIRGQETK